MTTQRAELKAKALAKSVERMRSCDVSYFPAYPGGQKAFDADCQTLAMQYLVDRDERERQEREDAEPITEDEIRESIETVEDVYLIGSDEVITKTLSLECNIPITSKGQLRRLIAALKGE